MANGKLKSGQGTGSMISGVCVNAIIRPSILSATSNLFQDLDIYSKPLKDFPFVLLLNLDRHLGTSNENSKNNLSKNKIQSSPKRGVRDDKFSRRHR
jgi:hypothetical protein